MSNVIAFSPRRSSVIAHKTQSAEIIAFPTQPPREDVLPRHLELWALERALRELAAAKVAGNLPDVLDWRDELSVIALHTDHFDIRSRCELALSA